MTTIDQQLAHYMSLPYRIEMIPDEGGWFTSIPDLPGCMSQGDTPQEALEMIRDAQRLWLRTALEDGKTIPPPATEQEQTYSGKFNVRVPKRLHRDLALAAKSQGTSLNLYIATTLARAAASDAPQTSSKPPTLSE
jgi:antitoxin HicB